MELSQQDITTIKDAYYHMMDDLQIYLVKQYETLTRADAKKYIHTQLIKLIKENQQ